MAGADSYKFTVLCLLFNVCLCTTLSVHSQCPFKSKVNLLDCTERGIKTVPRFRTNPQVVTLSLKNNKLTHINFTQLKLELRNVKFVIVSGNRLNCSELCHVKTLKIVSDCQCRLSHELKPTVLSTTDLLNSNKTDRNTILATSLISSSDQVFTNSRTIIPTQVSTSSTSSSSSSRLSSETLYIIIIILSLLFVMLLMLAVFLTCKYRDHRHSRDRFVGEIYELNEMIEHDEVVIYEHPNLISTQL